MLLPLMETSSKGTALHMPHPNTISVAVDDLAGSSEGVERTLRELGAHITIDQVLRDSEIFDAEMQSRDLMALIDQLKRMGDLKTRNIPSSIRAQTRYT